MRHPISIILGLWFVIELAGAQGPIAPFAVLRESFPPGDGLIGVADLDGDGDVDVVTTNGVRLNDGHGVFTAVAQPQGGFLVQDGLLRPQAALGDLDGDGLVDLFGVFLGVPRIWINLGGGVFVLSVTPLPTPISTVTSDVVLADLDRDGDLDVVMTHPVQVPGGFNPGPIEIWRNSGGVFTPSPSPATQVVSVWTALVDVDGDLFPDIVCANQPSGGTAPAAPTRIVLRNSGGGTFPSPPVILPGTPVRGETFDVRDADGDLVPDLLFSVVRPAGIGATQIEFLRGVGSGTFTLAGTSTHGGACQAWLADVTGDFQADVVVSDKAGVFVYPRPAGNAGALVPISTSSLSAATTIYVPSMGRSAVGDFDGDADLDIVVETPQGLRPGFNDLQGHLSAALGTVTSAGSAAGLIPADANGDGAVDLLYSEHIAAGAIPRVLRNDGRGNLAPDASVAFPVTPAPFPCRLTPVDVNHDGFTDLACVLPLTLTPARILVSSGPGTWVAGATVSLNSTVPIVAGDMDGDGLEDLVGATGPAIVVALNVGAAAITWPATGFAAPSGLSEIVLSDLDRDGDLDIVAGLGLPGASTASAIVYLNDGTAHFTTGAVLVGSVLPFHVTAADLDGDGDADLLMGGQLWWNAGTGTFVVGNTLPTGADPSLATTAFDVDGDGIVDVIDDQGRLYRGAPGGAFPTWESLPTPAVPLVHADLDRDGDEDLVLAGPRIATNLARNLARGAPVRAGRPTSLELAGPPLAPWFVFASPGPSTIPLAPMGTLLLDPAGLSLLGSGVLSTTGRAQIQATVPSTLSIIGFTTYVQAALVTGSGIRLTGAERMSVGY